MSTAILPKLDTSLGVIRWLHNLSLSAATSQFVVVEEKIDTPRPLEYHNLNDETLQALEDVDSGVGVERASTIAEMVKELDL